MRRGGRGADAACVSGGRCVLPCSQGRVPPADCHPASLPCPWPAGLPRPCATRQHCTTLSHQPHPCPAHALCIGIAPAPSTRRAAPLSVRCTRCTSAPAPALSTHALPQGTRLALNSPLPPSRRRPATAPAPAAPACGIAPTCRRPHPPNRLAPPSTACWIWIAPLLGGGCKHQPQCGCRGWAGRLSPVVGSGGTRSANGDRSR